MHHIKKVSSKTQTRQMVMSLVESEQDFEFYPTTNLMIDKIKSHIDEDYYFDAPSVLDCGAGDGRVLKALTDANKYAIEKSKPLLKSLDKDIYIVGTEFNAQTLIDKRCDVIFSNPPYSCFEQWATKLITEANSSYIYLIIPTRWSENKDIQRALELRRADVEIIGSFDFLDADRAARAKVDIVKISLSYGNRHNKSLKTDPFEIWFNENFKLQVSVTSHSEHELNEIDKRKLDTKLNNELVNGRDLVSTLESLYQRDLTKLIATYQSLSDIDPIILEELDVNLEGVKQALKLKIKNLKNRYWLELFDNLSKITDRLTAQSRKTLLSTLTANTHIDFTIENAHAIIIWVIKNANEYFDSQLICTVERMVEEANVVLYKSNQKTFGKEEWKYNREPTDLDNYSLDYRIVLSGIGGLNNDTWQRRNGLCENANNFLGDLSAIASNIGFNTQDMEKAKDHEWSGSDMHQFLYRDNENRGDRVLFEVRAYKNGNLHIKFNKDFICKLNVEFGRLKGWIKSATQASNEMDITVKQAAEYFGTNLKIENNTFLQLGFSQAA